MCADFEGQAMASIGTPLRRAQPGALIVATFALLAATALAQTPPPQRVVYPDPVDFLPAPALAPGEVPRPCATSGGLRSESQAEQRAASPLRRWGRKHLQFPLQCTDFDYVVSKWQETVGHPVTGVVTAADVARLDEEMKKAAPRIQEALAPQLAAQQQRAEAQQQAAAAAEAERAARRASAPTVFGIAFGVPLELPVCGPLRMFEPPPQTCQSATTSLRKDEVHVEFSREDLPGWLLLPSLTVRLVGGSVESIRFEPKTQAAAESR